MARYAYNQVFAWRLCLVAAMGGLLFGYDWVVIGGAKPFYEPHFGLDGEGREWLAGWAVSSALIGCLFGALLSGAITDRVGRKRVLIAAAAMFTLSAIWTAMAGDFNTFIAARILGGVGIGLASNVSPMYIAECSPAELRGGFVSINQLTIVIGVLAAQVANLAIYQLSPVAENAGAEAILASWNGQFGWRWMFAAEAIPAAAFFVLATTIPESPRWLIKQSRTDEAHAVLARLGGAGYAEQQIAETQQTLIAEGAGAEGDRADADPVRDTRLLGVLALGVFLAVFQQWCGINVIFNYAEEVFRAAGYNVGDLMFNIVITGAVNLGFTLVAIKTVDRWGRRPLMLLGAGGLAVTYAILGACYYSGVQGPAVLAVVLVAIACYAMTLAPVTWVLLAELFPNRIRGVAMSVCVASLWVACFLLTVTFKPLNAWLGAAGTFWLYGVICLIGFAVLAVFAPETKNRSLEEIEQQLLGRTRPTTAETA